MPVWKPSEPWQFARIYLLDSFGVIVLPYCVRKLYCCRLVAKESSMAGSRKRFSRFAVSFLLVCLTATLASGGEFWAKKPYQNWSPDEARRIQEESPWATTLTLGAIQS